MIIIVSIPGGYTGTYNMYAIKIKHESQAFIVLNRVNYKQIIDLCDNERIIVSFKSSCY